MVTSFRSYIERRRVTDTPAGDFTADAKRDNTMPDITTWAQLEGYLRHRRSACRQAIEAAKTVWRQFKRQAAE